MHFGSFELILLLTVFMVFTTIFVLLMIKDCIKNDPGEDNEKMLWLLGMAFGHIIGALVYFFTRRKKRIEEQRH